MTHRIIVLVMFIVAISATSVLAADFTGLGFGVGVSLTHDVGSHDRIVDAQVDANGIVRVNKNHNDIPRVMLESHYLFRPDLGRFDAVIKTLTGVDSGNRGIGPFVAFHPGSNETIDAIGMGLMIGFKRSSNIGDSTASWNFGVGAIVDPNVKRLGDNIIENSPLPAGETQIRYKETSQWGVLFITSYSF